MVNQAEKETRANLDPEDLKDHPAWTANLDLKD